MKIGARWKLKTKRGHVNFSLASLGSQRERSKAVCVVCQSVSCLFSILMHVPEWLWDRFDQRRAISRLSFKGQGKLLRCTEAPPLFVSLFRPSPPDLFRPLDPEENRNSFEHFLLKTMYQQPPVCEWTVSRRNCGCASINGAISEFARGIWYLLALSRSRMITRQLIVR